MLSCIVWHGKYKKLYMKKERDTEHRQGLVFGRFLVWMCSFYVNIWKALNIWDFSIKNSDVGYVSNKTRWKINFLKADDFTVAILLLYSCAP